MAVDEPAQCGVYEERSAREHARRHHGADGGGNDSRSRTGRGREDRARDARRGKTDGAGSAGECAVRALWRRCGRAGSGRGRGRVMASFEEQLTALESVVERLERGELSLEESVKLFEEGVKLSDACKKEL